MRTCDVISYFRALANVVFLQRAYIKPENMAILNKKISTNVRKHQFYKVNSTFLNTESNIYTFQVSYFKDTVCV
jgi:hypothetical protein